MTSSVKARDINFWIADVLAEGKPHWPVSRAELQGLRLRQIADAIKIYAAQVYCGVLKGEPPDEYETLKKSWAGLYLLLPTIFLREEDWQKTQTISDPQERSTSRMLIGAGYLNPDTLNEEESEFLNDETFESFIAYLERLPRDYEYIFPHALGHLSVRYIYVDDKLWIRD
jgi:hypothetical protein